MLSVERGSAHYAKKVVLLPVAVLLLQTTLVMAHSPPRDARVFFIGLEDGAVVSSPLQLRFGIEGFGIVPADTHDKRRHSAGHHHLLVDLEQLPDLDGPIPRSEHHIHFDRGETSALLHLTPGQHSLQLLLGDEGHEPFEPLLLSNKITITVMGE